MKIDIDATKREIKKTSIYDDSGNLAGFVEGEDEVLVLLDRLLTERRVTLKDIKEVSAKMEGESRVGILIGVSAANALNYALGLKGAHELEFPQGPSQGF